MPCGHLYIFQIQMVFRDISIRSHRLVSEPVKAFFDWTVSTILSLIQSFVLRQLSRRCVLLAKLSWTETQQVQLSSTLQLSISPSLLHSADLRVGGVGAEPRPWWNTMHHRLHYIYSVWCFSLGGAQPLFRGETDGSGEPMSPASKKPIRVIY